MLKLEANHENMFELVKFHSFRAVLPDTFRLEKVNAGRRLTTKEMISVRDKCMALVLVFFC